MPAVRPRFHLTPCSKIRSHFNGHEFTTAYEQASTNRLEVLFELFSFEPATKDDADRLLQFISDNLEAFRTWLTIADDDERASFFGRLAKAILHGRAAPEYDR